MRRFIFICCMVFMCTLAKAQFYSVKTNLLGWATTNMNIEGSVSIHRNWSVHLPINYNPWNYAKRTKFNNVVVEPGIRYWPVESYIRSFIGLQGIFARYHVSYEKATYRYNGHGWGAGLSYGYAKVISSNWNLEFEGGVGVLWVDQTKYYTRRCSPPLEHQKKPIVIPSKLSISVAYLF